MKAILKLSYAVVLAVMIAACATTMTFDKQVVVANAAVESASTLAGQLYDAGKISREDNKQTQLKLLDIRKTVEAARTLHKASTQEGADMLSTALVALNEITAYLEAHQ